MTEKQEKILVFIDEYIKKYGYSPTIREIGKAVGLSSSSSVHFHVRKLIKSGYLVYHNVNDKGSPRSLRIVR